MNDIEMINEKEKLAPEITTEKTDAPQVKNVGFLDLFRFSSRTDKLLMFAATISSILSGLAIPLMTVIFGKIINSFISYIIVPNVDDLNSSVNTGCLYFALLGTGIWLFCYLQMALFMYAGENQSNRIRQLFFESITRQDIAWFDKQETGDLVSRMVSDISLVQEGISDKLGVIVQNLTTFLAGFVIAYTKGYKLAGILTCVLPVMVLAGAFMSKVISSSSKNERTSYASASGTASQIFSSIKTVHSFNGQERAIEKYSGNLAMSEKSGIKTAVYTGIGLGLLIFLLFCFYSLSFYYGSILVQNKEMLGGDVLNVFFAIIIGAFSLGNVGPALGSVSSARGAASKVFEIIDLKSKIDPLDKTGISPSMVIGSVEFKDINFRTYFNNSMISKWTDYPQRPDVLILKNFNLKIEPGQTFALVGMSGSGKSTIVKLLERFYDVKSGSISLDDQNIQTLSVQWLRQQIGMVGQEPILFDKSIKQNVLYGYPYSTLSMTDIQIDELVNNALKVANAWEFIQMLPNKQDTTVGEAGSMLSGGQKQRIAIARAIIGNPKILLLDEATSALDTESERLVQAALDSASKGRTTIVIAHRLSTIKNADKIIVMADGEIIEQGTHQQLIDLNGTYSKLVASQELRKLEENSGIETKERIRIASELKPDDTEATLSSKIAIMGNNSKQPIKKNVGIMRILSYNGPEWYLFLFGSIGAVINGCVMPIFALVFATILSVFSETGDKLRTDANFWALMFFVLAVVSFIANFAQVACFRVAGEKLTKRLRELCFSAIVQQDMAFFDDDEHSSGILVSRLADDATQIQGLTGVLAGAIMQNFATVIAGLTIAFYYSWQLTLVTLTIVPFMAVGGYLQFRALKGYGGEAREQYNKIGKLASETILNIRTVATLTKEQHFINEYNERIKIPHRNTIKAAFVSAIGFGFAQGIMFFSYAIAFLYGSKLIIWGLYGPGDIMKVIFAIIFMAMAAGNASAFLPNITKAKLAAESVFDLIDKRPSIDSMSSSGLQVSNDRVHGQASADKVQFTYPKRPDTQVLNGLSFNVNPGQVIALVGQSGCGKSTIIGLLERFYDASHGSVSFDGKNVRDWNVQFLRNQMALVGQEPILFNVSIKENIMYGAYNGNASNEEIETSARKANIHEFIMSLPDGYSTLVGEKGGQLSGGQKQRIAIARALISNPKLLLLDEATSALDSESERLVQEALDSASKGRTTIVIAHRLSTIQNADIICVLRNGLAVEQGTHNELLLLGGLYNELVSQQSLSR